MSRERYLHGRDLLTVRQYLLKRDWAKAEEELKKTAQAGENLTDWQWTSWGWNVWDTAWALKDLQAGSGVYDRLAEVVKTPAGKTALEVSRVRFLLSNDKAALAEGRLSNLPALSAEAKFTVDILVARYGTADALAAAGNMDGAWRVFSGAWSESQALPQEQRSAALEQAFYPERRPNRYLPALLLRSVRAQAGTAQAEGLILAYCDAVVKSRRGSQEALGVLSEVKAKPTAYLRLANGLRDQGDEKGAQAVLNAISKEAAAADPELAKAIAGFWPSAAEKAAVEIERCRALIKTYEDRAQDAGKGGNTAAAKRYTDAVSRLQARIASLQAQMPKP